MSVTPNRFVAALASSTAEVPLTGDERLRAIEQMRERVNGYVQFIARLDSLRGSSAEAKEHALAAFHARMTVLERQLGRICEDLQLG
jgi:hypothetical protein